MPSSKTLLLRFAAPMQSCGAESPHHQYRRSSRHPSESQIIGLLAAAEGRGRNDSLDPYRGLKTAVRVDRPGTLCEDYQTAQGHFYNSAGQPVPYSSKYISRREYLEDAEFVVAVEGDSGRIEELARAVRRPVYQLYLGRKSCPPTFPLYLGVADCGLEQALRECPSRTGAGTGKDAVDLVAFFPSEPEDASQSGRRSPVSFAPNARKWKTRYEKKRTLRNVPVLKPLEEAEEVPEEREEIPENDFYFSTALLDPSKKKIWTNPAKMHGVTCSTVQRKGAVKVWSVYRDESGKMRVSMITDEEPVLESLETQVGTGGSGKVMGLDEWLGSIREGDRFIFKMKGNPSVPRVTDGKKKFVGIKNPEGELEWFAKRAERNGFSIGGLTLDFDGDEKFRTQGKIDPLVFRWADYSGTLTVTDREKFARALAGGIGRAKSYGMGMLLVRPVGSDGETTPYML